MELRYPQMILQKSEGLTDTERYLAKLCQSTFLSLWSFPNIYRDQGNFKEKKEGKEICDLLVVFDNHIIIFSDKECAIPNSGDIQLDWSRWYRKAVKESAEQIYGAERWIFSHPNRIFLDIACKQEFPLSIPNIRDAKVHRVVVAHASSKKTTTSDHRAESLQIVPRIIAEEHCAHMQHQCTPFAIGQVNPSKGYVHVLDNRSLDVVMKTLDTISDFVHYLEQKEKFIVSGQLLAAASEEELLAYYLQHIDCNGDHHFGVESNLTGIVLDGGLWNRFEKHPQRIAQLEANQVSYAWDKLIESFLKHLTAGTSYKVSHTSVNDIERGLRILARESRFRRRMLGHAFVELIEKTSSDMRATRTIASETLGQPHYVFFLLPRPNIEMTYETYREIRNDLANQYCVITKLDFPEAQDIICIATESGLKNHERSEDLVYLDASDWTEEDNKQAQAIRKGLQEQRLLSRSTKHYKNHREFPEPKVNLQQLGGNFRNKPCPCGSGLKYKKCCGR